MANNSLPYSTNEDIDGIRLWDRTVELVVYVDTITPRKRTGSAEHLKFYVTNGLGKLIQCIIWTAETIDKFVGLITVNTILHIDGCCARSPSKPQFNRGNVPFELQIFDNTEITSMGRHVPQDDHQDDINIVELNDVIHWEGRGLIKVNGFMKTCFKRVLGPAAINMPDYVWGSITDGQSKLEVRITSVENEPALTKGEAVTVTGKIDSQGGRVFMQVQTEDYIVADPERDMMPLIDVVMANRELRRVAEEQLQGNHQLLRE